MNPSRKVFYLLIQYICKQFSGCQNSVNSVSPFKKHITICCLFVKEQRLNPSCFNSNEHISHIRAYNRG